jgi:hypothetical protein
MGALKYGKKPRLPEALLPCHDGYSECKKNQKQTSNKLWFFNVTLIFKVQVSGKKLL